MIGRLLFIFTLSVTAPELLFSQIIIIQENFEDQNLSQKPKWTGDLHDFSFITENSNTLLRLNAEPTPTRTQLRTESPAAYGSWSFYYRPLASPSNTNRTFFFLMSDREDINYLDGSTVSGYALRAGDNQSTRKFRLLRFDNGAFTQILESDTEIVAGTGYQIRVERSADGEWQIFLSEGYGSEPVADSETVTDNTHNTSSWFGFMSIYSTANTQNFIFDDFFISSIEDFRITDSQVTSASEITLTFNFPVDENSYTITDFSTNLPIPLISALPGLSDREISLYFDDFIPDGSFAVTVNNVLSTFGHQLPPGTETEIHFQNPFRVLYSEVPDDHTILIQFTDQLTDASVSPEYFLLNGNFNPVEAEQSEPGLIELTFASPNPSGILEIEMEQMESTGGWVIPGGTVTRSILYDEYSPGDVIINEFMYRAPAGYVRYVELKNVSDNYLNLQNWELRRRADAPSQGGVFSPLPLTIEPNEFLVLTSDTTTLSQIFGSGNYHQMDNYPGFTLSTADQIRLFTNTGALADSLLYDPSTWGGNGVALERKSGILDAFYRENWEESAHPLLGTPGLENLAVPDTNPPVWEELRATPDGRLILTFSKRLNPEPASELQNFSITPTLNLSMVGVSNNEITLIPTQHPENNRIYEVEVRNLSDLFGNVLPTQTKTVEYLDFGLAAPGDLVINEIMYRRAAAGSPEFIEIYNTTDQNIDLSGWQLGNSGGAAVIPNLTAIRGFDYIVFTDTPDFAATDERIIRLTGFRSLNNSADAVVLRNENGSTIDSLYYNANWGGSPGVSIERKDPDAISIDPANWGSSLSESGSTPLETNSVLEPDTTPPDILFAVLRDDNRIEVRFSEFIDLHPETRFSVNGSDLSVSEFNPIDASRILLQNPLSPGTELIIRGENLYDFQGNQQLHIELPVAQPLQSDAVVFNEIMFNPIRDNRDHLPDQADYLELYNRMPYAISLEGIFIHDEPDENDDVTAILPVSTTNKWIPAHGYALLNAENIAEDFEESVTALFFDLEPELEPHTIRFNRTTLSLPLAGRPVYLADSTHNVIDMVHYKPDWHNPNIYDTKGIALERINPVLPTNDGSNWGSAANSLGGTPGKQNTLYQTVSESTALTGLTMEPNPFSPDGDGHEDHLFIRYKLDEPDYLIRVRIFDRYGRAVKTLAESHNAGFEGTLIWDGRTDQGQRTRVGIYIVLLDAYNSSTGRKRSFRETVVVARQF
jgi:hypothetical protein